MLVVGTLAAGPVAGQPPDTAPQSPAARPAPDPRRQDIQMMEIALTRALQTGARELAQLLKMNEPNSAFVTGTGRARGFILDGYGIFFDVDVPGMKQSVLWSSQMSQLAQEHQQAARAVSEMRPDDPRRPLMLKQVRQIEGLMTAAQAGMVLVPPAPAPTAPTQFIQPNRVIATEATLPVAESVAMPAAAAPAAAPPVAADAAVPGERPMPEVRDPNELYTESVKKALINAMLEYSKLLKIADTERLTVAASDSDGPQAPNQLDDTSRILISIRGADLAAFQAGKLTRDEMLKRVEVKEF
jgi:hypothetical protein